MRGCLGNLQVSTGFAYPALRGHVGFAQSDLFIERTRALEAFTRDHCCSENRGEDAL